MSFTPAQRDEGLQLYETTAGLLFRGGSLRLALALPAVLQRGVALKGEWEPGQATAATVSVSYPGC